MKTDSPPIRVVIIDDHPALMEGVAASLSHFDIAVVDRSASPAGIALLVDRHRPDVLLLDIGFGGRLSSIEPLGLNAARTLLKQRRDCRIVIYSQYDEDAMLLSAYDAGVMAFVTKTADVAVLAEAIRHACRGDVFFPPDIAQRLAGLRVRGTSTPIDRLDPRDVEIFRLLALASTNEEIAAQMQLSLKTISIATTRIKNELGASRPAELTLLAIKYGLIRPPR